jgi:hypothetical protein
MGVPVSPRTTVAADPAFVPLGAPVWLRVDRPQVSGLWVAQDTGGAIKGPNRFDSFWGAGADARLIAGGMSAHGQALVLPKGTGTLARSADEAGPRGLSAEELALWRRLPKPLRRCIHRHPCRRPTPAPILVAEPAVAPARKVKGRVPPPRPAPPAPAQPRPLHASGQGSTPVGTASWRAARFPRCLDRSPRPQPDLAHGRLLASLAQALAIGARVILLVTGKPRPHGDHDLRGERAARSAPSCSIGWRPAPMPIASVRPAQPRHGGTGAVYIVLRRPR